MDRRAPPWVGAPEARAKFAEAARLWDSAYDGGVASVYDRARTARRAYESGPCMEPAISPLGWGAGGAHEQLP